MNSSTLNSKQFGMTFAVAFLMGLSIFVGVTEAVLRWHVMPNDSYAGYKEHFRTSLAPAAAFGDSHAANALIGTVDFDNFGEASDNLDTMLAKIEYRMRRGHLRQIIIQADPQIFAPYRLKADQSSRVSNLLSEADPFLAVLRPEYRQYLTQYWWSTIQNPAMFFRSEETEPPGEEVTFSQLSQERQDREASIRVQLHAPAAYAVKSERAKAYRQIVQQLRAAEIEVCLVRFPVSSAYRRQAAAHATFVAAGAFFLAAAESSGAIYLDYSSIMTDDKFGNADHLSSRGAEEFTRLALAGCFQKT